MAYQVLARKWRPKTFKTVVGQTHVLQALINSLDNQRLHHAYLFTGTRGVGKTTLGRILAKCLNCESGITSEPCEQCDACTTIDAGCFVDLIEVDAASRTKVEDTRELLDNVAYAPSVGRFKVYLIDEVHMLSTHSFNALLKTLEEPPPHVKFILATTEPHKLPVTVLSRCLQFHLKHLSTELLIEHLAHILQAEGVGFEKAALVSLAQSAKGSARDALSLLEQAIAQGNGQVGVETVNAMLGLLDQGCVFKLLQALHVKDTEALFVTIQEISQQSGDFARLLEMLLSSLHQIACVKQYPQMLTQILVNQENIQALAYAMNAEDIQLFYQIGLIGRRDLPLAPDERVGFEMLMLRMLAFQPTPGEEKPERAIVAKPDAKPAAPLSVHAPVSPKQSSPSEAPGQKSRPPSAPSEGDNGQPGPIDWPTVYPQLGLRGISQALASHCAFHKQDGETLHLVLPPKQSALLQDKHRDRINEALNNYLKKQVKLLIDIGEAKQQSPAEQQLAHQASAKSALEESLEKDPMVQSLKENFGATLQPGSLQAKVDKPE